MPPFQRVAGGRRFESPPVSGSLGILNPEVVAPRSLTTPVCLTFGATCPQEGGRREVESGPERRGEGGEPGEGDWPWGRRPKEARRLNLTLQLPQKPGSGPHQGPRALSLARDTETRPIPTTHIAGRFCQTGRLSPRTSRARPCPAHQQLEKNISQKPFLGAVTSAPLQTTQLVPSRTKDPIPIKFGEGLA